MHLKRQRQLITKAPGIVLMSKSTTHNIAKPPAKGRQQPSHYQAGKTLVAKAAGNNAIMK